MFFVVGCASSWNTLAVLQMTTAVLFCSGSADNVWQQRTGSAKLCSICSHRCLLHACPTRFSLCQVLRIFAGDAPSKRDYFMELQMAESLAVRGIGTKLGTGQSKMVLVTSNMRRWQNGVTALVYNCCVAWTFRHQVLLACVGFAEDSEAMRFLNWACEAAVRDG
jgi:hypothetical protein